MTAQPTNEVVHPHDRQEVRPKDGVPTEILGCKICRRKAGENAHVGCGYRPELVWPEEGTSRVKMAIVPWALAGSRCRLRTRSYVR
jgi:hypothetical protein